MSASGKWERSLEIHVLQDEVATKMLLTPTSSRLATFVGLVIFGHGICAQKSTAVISKDVAIIGGGASGSHAAVRLREDFGKSVVVIEKQGHLVSEWCREYKSKHGSAYKNLRGDM